LYTDEEILKTQIDSKYPSLGEEERNLILQKTLQKEFGITGDEEDDKVGRLMMKLEADKIRDGLKAEQAQYKPKSFENPASAIEAQLKAQTRSNSATSRKLQKSFNFITRLQAIRDEQTCRIWRR